MDLDSARPPTRTDGSSPRRIMRWMDHWPPAKMWLHRTEPHVACSGSSASGASAALAEPPLPPSVAWPPRPPGQERSRRASSSPLQPGPPNASLSTAPQPPRPASGRSRDRRLDVQNHAPSGERRQAEHPVPAAHRRLHRGPQARSSTRAAPHPELLARRRAGHARLGTTPPLARRARPYDSSNPEMRPSRAAASRSSITRFRACRIARTAFSAGRKELTADRNGCVRSR